MICGLVVGRFLSVDRMEDWKSGSVGLSIC